MINGAHATPPKKTEPSETDDMGSHIVRAHVICPKCGFENLDDAMFCVDCYTYLDACTREVQYPPKKPAIIETQFLLSRFITIVIGLFFLVSGSFYEELAIDGQGITRAFFIIVGLLTVYLGIFGDESKFNYDDGDFWPWW